MPESHKAEKRRIQKANRAAGIGDEAGRIVRVKAAAVMSKCTICSVELKVTKTCTEIKQHAENKHGKTIEEVFPDAMPAAAELNAARAAPAAVPGPTKKEKKKVASGGLDDLLSAGLSAAPGKKKGKK
ncbi:hypothetical protein TL16_g04756 [Triparma laevis f. inornata]|uniref:Uncharacterized protein n=2 Tax=Triparma laevis TaxID=1534972 RepID=A0A9W7ALH4_9STRA|nr:hypothetical protein TL16_g04756 [Triparma laevis f. inornata]GMH70494.1 hypothetical protein TrLO_g13834 [Triparma laevis f. longispina]